MDGIQVWLYVLKLLKDLFLLFRISQRNTCKASISFSMTLAVPLQRFSIVLAFALASFNNSCMQNIINLWDYTEVLHNLCFVSTSFLFSETFFFRLIVICMGLTWPSFNVFPLWSHPLWFWRGIRSEKGRCWNKTKNWGQT